MINFTIMLRITILSLILFFSSCTALRPKIFSRDRDIRDIITSIPAEVKKLPVDNRKQQPVKSDPTLLDGFIKPLPNGWVLAREPISNWNSSLSAVMGYFPDSLSVAEFWDDPLTLKSGFRIPVRRAKMMYEYTTRLTIERIELRFINIDFIYSITNIEASHYKLESVHKTVELKDIGFPQVTTEDVLQHKIMMTYGPPNEFDGTWHRYLDGHTEMNVRILDDWNLAINLRGLVVEQDLRNAIEHVYSEQGIEYKKMQLMESFDL